MQVAHGEGLTTVAVPLHRQIGALLVLVSTRKPVGGWNDCIGALTVVEPSDDEDRIQLGSE